ncbi:MAG: HDIG domain-containing metalloprotein [Thermoanaerobaculia bacterium]
MEGKWPSREEAKRILEEETKNPRLLLHAKAVSILMKAYAKKFGEDEEKWEIVGILHDFDYEKNPTEETHIWKGMEILREKGYSEELILAIGSHADYTKIPRDNLMKKTLYAVDELSGFLIACALIKPSKKLKDVDVESVKKRMKDKAFARSVDREAIKKGAEELGVSLEEHIDFCIKALLPFSEELGV